MSILAYYFNEINKYSASKTSIFETQKIRNQNSQKGITKNALDFNKLAMLIYKLDFNYKSILINHKLLALSKVIKLTNFDINRLGTKYINKKKNKIITLTQKYLAKAAYVFFPSAVFVVILTRKKF